MYDCEAYMDTNCMYRVFNFLLINPVLGERLYVLETAALAFWQTVHSAE